MIFRLYEVITNRTQIKTGCFPSSFRTSNSNDTNLNGVPLPKHISDTLYASIIRTYKDAFTLSPKSTMSMKWALADDMNSTLRRRRSFRMDWTPKAKRKTNSSSLKRSSSMRESYRGSVTWPIRIHPDISFWRDANLYRTWCRDIGPTKWS